VLPIAFTSPLFGALAAVALGGETLTWRTAFGMALTLAGVALVGSR
jgi:transporter family protein